MGHLAGPPPTFFLKTGFHSITHYAAQADNLPALASQMLGQQICMSYHAHEKNQIPTLPGPKASFSFESLNYCKLQNKNT